LQRAINCIATYEVLGTVVVVVVVMMMMMMMMHVFWNVTPC